MANDLTLARGTTTYAASKFANGLAYGGVVTCPAAPLHSTVGTIEGWLKVTGSGTKVAIGNFAGGGGMWIGLGGSGVAAYGAPGAAVNSTVTINDGAWHHVALTIDGSNIKFFVDGTLANTRAYTGTFDTTYGTVAGGDTLALMAFGTNNAYDWPGGIDEVRVSNVVRYTGAFTPPAAAFADDSNTTALWHLDSSLADSHAAGGGGDTTAPTITSFTATPGNAQVALAWAGTDNVGITRWLLKRGTTTIYDGTATSYTDTGLTNGTAYTYNLVAYDAAGNVSGTSSITATPALQTVIAANDAGIIYSPFNWDVTATRAATINAGAYLRTTVAGATGITLNFDMTNVATPVPRIKVRVDNGSFTTFDLAASIALTLPTDNAWTTHHIELVIAATSEFVTRWNPQTAIVKLLNITCAGTATVRAAPSLAKKVCVFGDSITEGYKNAKNVTTPDGSDATVAWSYLQRQLLGAEVGVVGFGGQGWTSSGQGGVPGLTTAWNLLWAGTSRSFTSPAPDLVIVNMGENGGADATVVTNWLTALLAAVPAATRIVIMRPFSGTGAVALQQAVTNINNGRVTYLDTTGWLISGDALDGQHPTGFASQVSLGPRLANAVRPLLASYRRFINKAGAAVGVS